MNCWVGMEDQLRIPSLEQVPILQTHWLCNTHTINKGAIRAPQIGEYIRTADGLEPGVVARDFAVCEGHSVDTTTPQMHLTP